MIVCLPGDSDCDLIEILIQFQFSVWITESLVRFEFDGCVCHLNGAARASLHVCLFYLSNFMYAKWCVYIFMDLLCVCDISFKDNN